MPSPTRATRTPPPSSARRSRSSSRVATSSPAPRPGPARPRPSCCRCCSSSMGDVRPVPRTAAPDRRDATRPPIRALILTPTRELALQVEESVRTYGAARPIRSTTIYGGVGFDPQVRALRAGPEIVVATPGRLLDHLEPAHDRPVPGRDPRPRRGRPHAGHGLHPRHPQGPRGPAAQAPEPAVLGHVQRRDPPARRRVPGSTRPPCRSRPAIPPRNW